MKGHPVLKASVCAALLLGTTTGAQHMNEKDSPCAGIGQTADLTNCLAEARDKVDAELNSVYKDVRGRLGREDAERLLVAQRLWLQYRDANCSAERELYDSGTAKYPAYIACLEAMTRARSRELKVTYAVKLKD